MGGGWRVKGEGCLCLSWNNRKVTEPQVVFFKSQIQTQWQQRGFFPQPQNDWQVKLSSIGWFKVRRNNSPLWPHPWTNTTPSLSNIQFSVWAKLSITRDKKKTPCFQLGFWPEKKNNSQHQVHWPSCSTGNIINRIQPVERGQSRRTCYTFPVECQKKKNIFSLSHRDPLFYMDSLKLPAFYIENIWLDKCVCVEQWITVWSAHNMSVSQSELLNHLLQVESPLHRCSCIGTFPLEFYWRPEPRLCVCVLFMTLNCPKQCLKEK